MKIELTLEVKKFRSNRRPNTENYLGPINIDLIPFFLSFDYTKDLKNLAKAMCDGMILSAHLGYVDEMISVIYPGQNNILAR